MKNNGVKVNGKAWFYAWLAGYIVAIDTGHSLKYVGWSIVVYLVAAAWSSKDYFADMLRGVKQRK